MHSISLTTVVNLIVSGIGSIFIFKDPEYGGSIWSHSDEVDEEEEEDEEEEDVDDEDEEGDVAMAML